MLSMGLQARTIPLQPCSGHRPQKVELRNRKESHQTRSSVRSILIPSGIRALDAHSSGHAGGMHEIFEHAELYNTSKNS
jgi:hypothetical protein